MPPYEFFAMKYLNQWLQREIEFYEDISGNYPSTESISKSLHFFKVARSFRGLSDVGAKEYVIDALLDNSKRLTINNYTQKVMALAECFSDRFGTTNISAASKLMWLRKRSPIIIYDSLARKALENEGLAPRAKYPEYCEFWLDKFLSAEKSIIVSCNRLLEVKDFCSLWDVNKMESREIVQSQWFHERVFDMSLLYRAKNAG